MKINFIIDIIFALKYKHFLYIEDKLATRKKFLFIIFIFFLLCLFVIYVSYSYILKKQDELFYNLYLNTNDKIIDTTKTQSMIKNIQRWQLLCL